MAINLSLFNKDIRIDSIALELKNGNNISIDILRLDLLHETISGNKWFKLKYNLLEAEKQNAKSILTFGGAYSNHLHALAYAGKLFKIKTIGLVRGEKVTNPTLKDCEAWGMDLHFISRSEYRKKIESSFLEKLQKDYPASYIIPEGGDNELGKKGCEEILEQVSIDDYEVLACSIGTGTTLKGLSSTFIPLTNSSNKQIWGFAPFKNAHSLKEKLTKSINQLRYIDTFHFGGFGKSSQELRDYKNHFEQQYKISLDKIYTAKMFFGLESILNGNNELQRKKILLIHTGGLQGNRSSNS